MSWPQREDGILGAIKTPRRREKNRENTKACRPVRQQLGGTLARDGMYLVVLLFFPVDVRLRLTNAVARCLEACDPGRTGKCAGSGARRRGAGGPGMTGPGGGARGPSKATPTGAAAA